MLLLDSQAVLWVLDDNPKLGRRARALIASSTRVYVSATTIWELTVKAMLGKLVIPAQLASRVVQQGLLLLNVSAEHAEGIREFPELVRHDPFDRILLSQANQAGLDLLTADGVLLDLGHDFIINAKK